MKASHVACLLPCPSDRATDIEASFHLGRTCVYNRYLPEAQARVNPIRHKVAGVRIREVDVKVLFSLVSTET